MVKQKKKEGAERHTKAYQVLTRLQKALLKRLADYVLQNEAGLRQAAEGAEGYSFSLHQIDEIFLSRLNLIERAMAELQKAPAHGANRYRSMVFSASRAEVEREINSRLKKVPSARILGVTVSPMSAPSRVTYQFTDLAPPGPPVINRTTGVVDPTGPRGSESGAGGSQESVAKLVRSAATDEGQADDGPGDVVVDLPEVPCEDPGNKEDDELLVTVLYYGPAAASDA